MTMAKDLLFGLLLSSVSVSALTAVMLLFRRVLGKKYSLRAGYVIWLVLAVRLIIPFSLPVFELPSYNSVRVENTASVNPNVSETSYSADLQAESHTDIVAAEESGKRQALPDVYTLAAAIWILGAAGFFTYHAAAYVRFKIKIKPSLTAAAEDGILKSEMILRPVSLGFLKPIIILPDVPYTDRERELIIAHERVHIRRHDTWYKLLLLLANSAHWFNPIIYFMVRAAERDIEFSCDSEVVKNKETAFKREYSMAVLKHMR